MKVLICDYPNVMEADYSLTINSIKEIIPDAQVSIFPFNSKEELYNNINEMDGLITAFLPIDRELIAHAPKLKCVSINAVGYGNVDLDEAKKKQIGICHIEEYCTQEVAEHTMALILSLNKNLKYYTEKIESFEWKYHSIQPGRALFSQTLAIFGFGKIGRKVAELAKAFGMKVLVVDPFVSEKEAEKLNVNLVCADVALANADIVSNHMNLTKENYHYFQKEVFEKMKKQPLFINVGRGGCVKEEDLVKALDSKIIRGAGLDVLEAENPNLKESKLLGRSNVIITPHSAFYSEQSMEKLQTVSAKNLAYYLTNDIGNIHKIVNS